MERRFKARGNRIKTRFS